MVHKDLLEEVDLQGAEVAWSDAGTGAKKLCHSWGNIFSFVGVMKPSKE